MKEKYDKYWGDIDKINLLMFVACVLDLRKKLKYLEFALSEMSSSKKSCKMMQKLKNLCMNFLMSTSLHFIVLVANRVCQHMFLSVNHNKK